VLVFVQAINQGFMPSYARAGVDSTHKAELRRIVCLQIAIVTAGAAAAITLAGPTVSLVAPSSYQGATSLLGWLVLGFFFLGLYYIPMNGATLGAKRGKFAWIVTVFSAVVNLGLIVALVPAAGVEAAVIASAVGYFVLLVGIAVYARGRGNPVEYDWMRIVSLLSLAGVFVAAALLVTPASGLGAFAIRLGGSLAVAIALIGISVAGSGRTGSMPIVRLSG
jgi:O-antigen/teichoic acid export membrane protein